LKVLAIALALLDFAPVFFLAVGLLFFARLAGKLDPRCFRMGIAGFILVTVGGLARAVSNLALAITGAEIPVLAISLLVFAGPGFALCAGALYRGWQTRLGRPASQDPWIVPVTLSWAFLLLAFYVQSRGGEGREWARVLFVLAWGGSLATCALAAALGWRERLHMSAGLLAFHAFAMTLLAGVGFLGLQSIWIQVIAELLDLAAQMAFAFAAWRISAEYLTKD
jgi:hypothetical protein